MKKSDVIVIGGGMAGLTAALAAADQGRTVTLLAKGVGTLAFGGGVIDVLGYQEGRLVKSPRQQLGSLPVNHPYTITGTAPVADGLDYLQRLCTAARYPLDGSLDANLLVPTAAGTFKPSCLVPKTMNAADMSTATLITVVAFAGLKDFYPQMVISGLRELQLYLDKEYQTVTVHTGLPGGRDVSALDIARWLDTSEGQQELLSQLKAAIQPGSYVLMPPVLGTEPSYELWLHLEEQLSCRVVELAAPPPAITGSRLRTLLLRALKKQGIRLIEQAHVRRVECRDHRCTAVITQHLDRERTYEAQAFILATGGFLGGGLEATPQGIKEAVFGLPVTPAAVGMNQCGSLFDTNEMFSAGISVDSLLRPCDQDGKVLFANVHLAGNIMAGYDYCQEKSGNGVAVVTGYQAAMAIARSEAR